MQKLLSRQARSTRKPQANTPWRICRFELMEPRQMLSADISPIHIGAVYLEDGSGLDQDTADQIEITYLGGAADTQLSQVTIRTDKDGDGLTGGDPFCDTAAGGLGAYAPMDLEIVESNGFTVVNVDYADGGTEITFTFSGFDAGERLVFSLDFDEWQGETANAVVEGWEFQGSILSATFTSDHYYTAQAEGRFYDAYDPALAASGLSLPPDSYSPPSPTSLPIYTAGAFASTEQEPLPNSIAGTVFEDLDYDNVRDSGEPGIGGATLTLYDLDDPSFIQTTLTTSAGTYFFGNLAPGNYRVVETQPAGYQSIGAKVGTVDGATRGTVESVDGITGIVLIAGEDSIRNDFAEARPTRLSGHVFHDANDNGLFDAGETGIPNVQVTVTRTLGANATIPLLLPSSYTGGTAFTDANGYWSVSGLLAGEYHAIEQQPTGYFDGKEHVGTAGGTSTVNDRFDGVVLAAGQQGENYDFGELLPGSISGKVYVDENADGVYQTGEELLSGVTIRLTDANGSVTTTQTDAAGEYLFDGLQPGVYQVTETQPTGYYDGADNLGSIGGRHVEPDTFTQIALPSGIDAVRYDFGELRGANLSGYVYADDDDDALFDTGESGIPNTVVRLFDATGSLVAQTQTDASGYYHFDNLKPGNYTVRETQPSGYKDGKDAVGTVGGTLGNDVLSDIPLAPGANARQYNFGELKPVALSGHVFVDLDDDGIRDAAEAGIPDTVVKLLDQFGNTIAQTKTDTGGYYEFTDLEPGLYGLQEMQPGGYKDGKDSLGSAGGVLSNDRVLQIPLAPGDAGVDYDFGELLPASIQGRVHADTGMPNQTYDPGEPLLGGVTIYLLNASGQRIKSTTTDAMGEYSFENLDPGTYGVEEIQPVDYLQGGAKAGSEGGTVNGDFITQATLGPGVDGVHYDFFEIVPAQISGYVFQDGPAIRLGYRQEEIAPHLVRDGKYTRDDTPIAGVTLRLCNRSGMPILDRSGNPITTVTDKNGYYEFTGLKPGRYTVLQSQPEGYRDSIDTPGTLGGLAINANMDLSALKSSALTPGLGQVSPLAELLIDPLNDAILAIDLTAGASAEQNNFSEVRYQRDPWNPPYDRPDPEIRYQPRHVPLGSSPGPASPPLPYTPRSDLGPIYGGGGVYAHTWQLSVINAGTPRKDAGWGNVGFVAANDDFDPNYWSGRDMHSGHWRLYNGNHELAEMFRLGFEDAIPVTGDFNGDGKTEVGIFRDGFWFIDLNGNGIWDEGDLWAKLGKEGDQPVTGDWDGDGKTDIGVYGPSRDGDFLAISEEPGIPDRENPNLGRYKNLPPDMHVATEDRRIMKRGAHGKFREDVVDHVFRFGKYQDHAVAGDWNGDGVATIGIFRDGYWFLDMDGNGAWGTNVDRFIEFGDKGDLPVVGDWNGDGIDDIGIYRNGHWVLDADGNCQRDAQDKVFEMGGEGDIPVSGDWDGDGTDEVGLYQDKAA